jgi:hypothetical protein
MDPSASPLSLALSHHSDSDPHSRAFIKDQARTQSASRHVAWLVAAVSPQVAMDADADPVLRPNSRYADRSCPSRHAPCARSAPSRFPCRSSRRSARALHRIDQPPNISGVNAVQDADLRSDAMHRQTDALHVERDGARGEVGFAPGLKSGDHPSYRRRRDRPARSYGCRTARPRPPCDEAYLRNGRIIGARLWFPRLAAAPSAGRPEQADQRDRRDAGALRL